MPEPVVEVQLNDLKNLMNMYEVNINKMIHGDPEFIRARKPVVRRLKKVIEDAHDS